MVNETRRRVPTRRGPPYQCAYVLLVWRVTQLARRNALDRPGRSGKPLHVCELLRLIEKCQLAPRDVRTKVVGEIFLKNQGDLSGTSFRDFRRKSVRLFLPAQKSGLFPDRQNACAGLLLSILDAGHPSGFFQFRKIFQTSPCNARAGSWRKKRHEN